MAAAFSDDSAANGPTSRPYDHSSLQRTLAELVAAAQADGLLGEAQDTSVAAFDTGSVLEPFGSVPGATVAPAPSAPAAEHLNDEEPDPFERGWGRPTGRTPSPSLGDRGPDASAAFPTPAAPVPFPNPFGPIRPEGATSAPSPSPGASPAPGAAPAPSAPSVTVPVPAAPAPAPAPALDPAPAPALAPAPAPASTSPAPAPAAAPPADEAPAPVAAASAPALAPSPRPNFSPVAPPAADPAAAPSPLSPITSRGPNLASLSADTAALLGATRTRPEAVPTVAASVPALQGPAAPTASQSPALPTAAPAASSALAAAAAEAAAVAEAEAVASAAEPATSAAEPATVPAPAPAPAPAPSDLIGAAPLTPYTPQSAPANAPVSVNAQQGFSSPFGIGGPPLVAGLTPPAAGHLRVSGEWRPEDDDILPVRRRSGGGLSLSLRREPAFSAVPDATSYVAAAPAQGALYAAALAPAPKAKKTSLFAKLNQPIGASKKDASASPTPTPTATYAVAPGATPYVGAAPAPGTPYEPTPAPAPGTPYVAPVPAPGVYAGPVAGSSGPSLLQTAALAPPPGTKKTSLFAKLNQPIGGGAKRKKG